MAISFQEVEEWRERNRSKLSPIPFLSKPDLNDPICKDPAFGLLLRASLEFNPSPKLLGVWRQHFKIEELNNNDIVQHAKLQHYLNEVNYLLHPEKRTVYNITQFWALDKVYDRKSDNWLQHLFFELDGQLRYITRVYVPTGPDTYADLPSNTDSNISPREVSDYFIYHQLYKCTVEHSRKMIAFLEEVPFRPETVSLCLDADEFSNLCENILEVDPILKRAEILSSICNVPVEDIKHIDNLGMDMSVVDIIGLCKSKNYQVHIEAAPLPDIEV